jgi:hypothetical protein
MLLRDDELECCSFYSKPIPNPFSLRADQFMIRAQDIVGLFLDDLNFFDSQIRQLSTLCLVNHMILAG